MMQQQHNVQSNPWYRGYMPRSYNAPHKLASYGCSTCLISFGVFLLICGTILMVISNVVNQQDNDPAFQSDFFKKAREGEPNIPNIMHTIGSVVLSVGGIFFLSAVGLCCFAKYHMSNHDNEQRNLVAISVNQHGGQHAYVSPPGSYPQQQYFPAPGSYPQQPVVTSYPQQTAPPNAYPYPHPYPQPSELPPPYETCVSGKNAPYPGSQGPTTASAPPIR